MLEFAPLILIVVIGSSLGSFFNVCIYRIPQKKSILFPSSYCPHCSKPIRLMFNIPLIGFFLTKGKCLRCSAKIHWHYPLVEFLSAFLFLMLFLRFRQQFTFLYFKYALLTAVFIIIFFIDFFHKIIPDVLSLPLIPLGLIAAFHPANEIGFLSSLIGGASGFLLFYMIALVYSRLTGKMGIGGGDIKLIAGIGTFVGVSGILYTILSSSVLALLLILMIRHDLKKEFPFGPFLIAGTLSYVFFGYVIINWYLNLFQF